MFVRDHKQLGGLGGWGFLPQRVSLEKDKVCVAE